MGAMVVSPSPMMLTDASQFRGIQSPVMRPPALRITKFVMPEQLANAVPETFVTFTGISTSVSPVQ